MRPQKQYTLTALPVPHKGHDYDVCQIVCAYQCNKEVWKDFQEDVVVLWRCSGYFLCRMIAGPLVW